MECLVKKEQIMWMQKSRINWIIQEDQNTKFYHTITTRRRLRNKITCVVDEQGIWVNSYKKISATFCNHFKNVFSSLGSMEETHIKNQIKALNIPTLGPNQQEWLNQPFTPEEIRTVAFQIGPLKVPGIDGKLGLFYQKFRHIVGISLLPPLSHSQLQTSH